MAIDFSRQVNMSGNDELVTNERTRCTPVPITLTGSAGLGSAYSTNTQGTNWIAGFGPPRTGTSGTNFTALAADLLTGIITWKNTNTASSNMTLDSAANMVAAVNQISSGAQVGDYISCLVINSTGSGAGGIITVVNGSGGSFDANQTAPTILVGASRYLFIRLTNVTAGSEAYVLYT
jgi:hypothetical protein